jgi:hypothetical protein
MTAVALMENLASRGILLSRRGDKLRAEGGLDLLTDDLRQVLDERKQELLAVLTEDWFTAAGTLLIRHAGSLPSDSWWELDEQFARQVTARTNERTCRGEAERLAYLALAQALGRCRSDRRDGGGE